MDQGSGVVAGRRVDDHPRWFVDDRDVLVLIDDLQGDLLASRFDNVCLGDLELDDVPGRHPVGRVGRVPVDNDQVTLDQACGGGPAQVVSVLGQEAIEPRRCVRGDQALGRRST
jgi:hypothetical protein